MIIQGYKITSNHASGLYPANVRVKSPDGVLVAHVVANRGDVLKTIRGNMLCEERAMFISQLSKSGVPEDVIMQIVAK